jgi:hypothetical protein
MTERRAERDRKRREKRQAREAEERLRKERGRRWQELMEAWRRNHPSVEEVGERRSGSPE